MSAIHALRHTERAVARLSEADRLVLVRAFRAQGREKALTAVLSALADDLEVVGDREQVAFSVWERELGGGCA